MMGVHRTGDWPAGPPTYKEVMPTYKCIHIVHMYTLITQDKVKITVTGGSAKSDDKVGIMTNLGFRCPHERVLDCGNNRNTEMTRVHAMKYIHGLVVVRFVMVLTV